MTGAGRMKNGRQNAEKEKIVSLENEVDRLSRAYNFESYSISEKGEHLNE